MNEMDYDLGDIIEMKKEHPCHKSKEWKTSFPFLDVDRLLVPYQSKIHDNKYHNDAPP